MKTKSIFLFLSLLMYFGCADDDNPSVPTAEIHASLFLTVNNPAGLPVQGATISIGDLTGVTDEEGTIFFTNITLSGDDYLQVEKHGYFKGSRRFQTIEANTQFLTVTLLPLNEIGDFLSTQTAVLPIDAKSKLTFPANSITRADGSPYTGRVNVMASPIYGDDPLLSSKMPGDLTGLDLSDSRVVLSSFGMIGVELQADNGDLLQVAPGKSVELELAIGAQQLNTAPSTIALWYFDEDKGLWVQEGEAVREGNVYVAQIPHFTFWNCDVPNTLINWEARLIFEDGKPAQNVEVCLTVQKYGDQRCGNTDGDGNIYGAFPADEEMTMHVLNDCGNIMYTQELGAFTEDAKMGNTKINSSASDKAFISGIALQCDGNPLSKGFVRVRTPDNVFIFPIQNAEGHFSGNYTYCDGDYITLKVYDEVNGLVSVPQILTFDRNLNIGNISTCVQEGEFIRYKITGFEQEYKYSFVEMKKTNITKFETIDSIGYRGRIGWTFDGTSPGQYKGYAVSGNQINLPNGQVGYILKMDVTVTDYGAVGDYVIGSFSGKINVGGNGAGGQGQSDFSGTFSVQVE